MPPSYAMHTGSHVVSAVLDLIVTSPPFWATTQAAIPAPAKTTPESSFRQHRRSFLLTHSLLQRSQRGQSHRQSPLL